MGLAVGKVHDVLDVFFGVEGDTATVLIWRSAKSSPPLFATTAAKAMAQLTG